MAEVLLRRGAALVQRRSARLADAAGGNRKDHEDRNNGGSRSPQPHPAGPALRALRHSTAVQLFGSHSSSSVSPPRSPAHCQSAPLKSVPRSPSGIPSSSSYTQAPSPVQAVPSVLPILVFSHTGPPSIP